jgi:hypothetical protein
MSAIVRSLRSRFTDRARRGLPEIRNFRATLCEPCARRNFAQHDLYNYQQIKAYRDLSVDFRTAAKGADLSSAIGYAWRVTASFFAPQFLHLCGG